MIEPLILIRGAGEIASGVAYRLIKAGYPVVMTDSAAPQLVYSTISYGMCLAYTSVIIEGIIARRVEVGEISATLAEGVIPVLVDSDGEIIEALHPRVIVDTWASALNVDSALMIRVESELTTTS